MRIGEALRLIRSWSAQPQQIWNAEARAGREPDLDATITHWRRAITEKWERAVRKRGQKE